MIYGGPDGVEDGLVFYIDTLNEKSYRGEPTVNYGYYHNARTDPSYAIWDTTSFGGTFYAKHPDAIRVYNDTDGYELTNYVNTGVGDWTNTYHAIWTYDSILKRPVVTMRDFDGIWKAKSFGLGINFSAMSVGSQYTISWLQWVDNLSKCANTGLYTKNVGGTWNFWDGLSYVSSTSYNTKLCTWQRVYCTFTITANWDLTYPGQNIYMYGHDTGGRNTLKIADVQIELKSHPTQFTQAQTRSNTQGLLDITGNTTLDLTNTKFDSSANIDFPINASANSYITTNTNCGLTDDATLTAWIKPTFGTSSPHRTIICTDPVYQYGIKLMNYKNVPRWGLWLGWGSSNYEALTVVDINNNVSKMLTGTWNRASGIVKLYLNGAYVTEFSTGYTGPLSLSTGNIWVGMGYELGFGNGQSYEGKIYSAAIYNKTLSVAEIGQLYNATKGRYGL